MSLARSSVRKIVSLFGADGKKPPQQTVAQPPAYEAGPTQSLYESVLEEDVDLVAFEPVSGVVTRELRPSTESIFTCHSYSKDGSILATGESNGTLRLWNTFDYQCNACWSKVFQSPVSVVRFFKEDSSRVIAADRKGYISEFTITVSPVSESQDKSRLERMPIQAKVYCDDTLGNSHDALMHQFSQDGDVFISTRHQQGEENIDQMKTVIDIRSFRDRQEKQVTLTLDNTPICIPILAKNGNSLLMLCPPKEECTNPISGIRMVPELNFECSDQRTVDVPGTQASWGRMGEYLLVWSRENDTPKLAVYNTKHFFQNYSRTPAPLCERKLRQGSSTWKARMFDKQLDNDNKEVLICEIDEDWTIFSVWDIRQDKIVKEVKLVLSPGNSLSEERPLLTKRSILRRRSRRPPTPENEFIFAVLSDAFPDFCGSVDKNWFGAVSWNYQSIGLSSMRMGVTAWASTFADDLLTRPSIMPNQVMFDPPGHHLMMFGERVIQAFAPSFLDEHFTVGLHIEEFDQKLTSLDSVERRERLLEAYRCLPSKSLAKAWETGGSVDRTRLAWFRRRREVYRGETVIDAAISDDNQLLALILRDFRGSVYASVRAAGHTVKHNGAHCGEVMFPLKIRGRQQEFSPERVFLIKNLNGEDSMIFLSTGTDPVAVFCGIEGQTQDVLRLKMGSCFKISKLMHSSTVFLLDDDSVCVLDLQKRKVTDWRPYQISIQEAIREIDASLRWRCVQRECLNEPHSDYQISASGDAVLLAWDVKNKKSIVITPTTKEEDLKKSIRAADGCLSEFCLMSPSGTYTAFLDVCDLSRGCVTIGVFYETEEKVTFHVEVDRDVPTDMEAHDMQRMLANVFYGISEYEENLVVNTVGLSTHARQEPILDDHFKRFIIHKDIRCVPNHDLLELVKGTTDEVRMERLRMLHGVSLFNLPLPIQRTMFQDALSHKRKLLITRLKELAKRQGIGLALEWEVTKRRQPSRRDLSRSRLFREVIMARESVTSESSDVLKKALATNSTNEIEEAVHLVCSDLAPFASSAKIVKDSFKDLLWKECHVIEAMLSKNWLLHKVCEVEVHVDFMNPKSRREKAIHLHTTDSYLDWSDREDQGELDQQWRSQNSKELERMEKHGNTSTKKALLVFIRIQDAAKAGIEGIIRPLLFKHVPLHFFEYKIVKWVVTYKWLKIWKKRFIWQGLEYLCFLIAFTGYASILALSDDIRDRDLKERILHASLVGTTAVFGLRMATEELQQMLTYVQEGQEYFGSRWMGLRYFLSFKWNWVDMFSCLMLVILIPLFHTLASIKPDCEEMLSMLVALEAITAFVKAWYFAQPFRVFGSLVQMVGDVIRDCFAFLLLGFSVLVGFAVAFHVLFRHIVAEAEDMPCLSSNSTVDGNCTSSDLDDVQSSFGSFHRSLLTLFSALLGEFELDVYLSTGKNLSWLTMSIFIVYILTQTIIMLNFLISLMGDTFDRVKDDEKAELLSGCAEFIDACEASLSPSQCNQINKQIGKYLTVLIDPKKYQSEILKPSKKWLGKLKRIETLCTGAVDKAAKEQRDWIENTVMSRLADLTEKIDRLEASEQEMRECIAAQDVVVKNHMNGLEERMKGWVAEQNENLKREIAKLDEKYQTETRHFAEQLATASTPRVESQHKELVEKLDRLLYSSERQSEQTET